MTQELTPSERLYRYFKQAGITPKEIAERTGYSYKHVIELLRGTEHLSGAARFKFITAYPETAKFLLVSSGDSDEQAAEEPTR